MSSTATDKGSKLAHYSYPESTVCSRSITKVKMSMNTAQKANWGQRAIGFYSGIISYKATYGM